METFHPFIMFRIGDSFDYFKTHRLNLWCFFLPGDGVNAFMRFKVSTRTNLTYFKSSQFSVFRRFSDFLGLYEKLVAKHIQYGRIVPPPPEKNMSGMTKVGNNFSQINAEKS